MKLTMAMSLLLAATSSYAFFDFGNDDCGRYRGYGNGTGDGYGYARSSTSSTIKLLVSVV